MLPAERSRTSLEFTAEFGTLSVGAATVQQHLGLTAGRQQRRDVTYLDTFDWALSRAGWRLTESEAQLELTAQPAGTVLLRCPGTAVDRLAADLPAPLQGKLAAAIGLRALLPVGRVVLGEVVLLARNGDQKITSRLVVSAPEIAGGPPGPALRLTVIPLRGYAREASRLAEQLAELAGVQATGTSLFTAAVEATGRRVGDYTGKMTLRMTRDQPAYEAARQIFGAQLATMAANTDGVLADLDTEFLHDFRVAVRRTRTALKELPGILPAPVEERFRREFKWLGDITTPTRDLDVYLLTFPEFAASAGGAESELEPLRKLLIREQRKAQRALARQLTSARYQRLYTDWERRQAPDAEPADLGPAARTPIGALADARIRRVGRRVLRSGDTITDSSPAEALHDLRKRCKELRYLLEFFGTLYDSSAVGGLVSALKGLQDNLGEFQDTAVQHAAVDGFAESLLAERRAPAATLLALGRLGGTLERRQVKARAEFGTRFAAFAAPANRQLLASMTGAAR